MDKRTKAEMNSKAARWRHISPLHYVLEDWMKRSCCLLQIIRYLESVKKTSADCYKSLKSQEHPPENGGSVC